ncbi:sulfatase-like hydrolase/transferase [Lederbergia graminis]|uniref:Sulfatase-like hydrolase/transferase n=1 Tax=Lederbergia graminis TaxID=735518 RepID=A0ABW0LIG5_9BACI
MRKTQKNILIIMSDEQRWDTLGSHGNPTSVTPNIDALAKSGMSMDRCYTVNPLCCPARASLWTGLMPHEHHVMGNWRRIRPDLQDEGLIKNFKEAGYHTIYTGKWHVPGTTPSKFHFNDMSSIPAILNGRDRGRFIEPYRKYAYSKGYELVDSHVENLTKADLEKMNQPGKAPCGKSEISLEDYLETWQTKQFLDLLERRPDKQPFFAVCSYNAPHFPMIVPEPYDTIVSPEEVVLPPNFCKGMDGKATEVFNSGYEKLANLDEYEWRRFIAHYLGFCALIDDQVGEITHYLKQKGIFNDTIIVFVSDHGDMMGSHGLVEKGFPLHYEEALRVPLIIANYGEIKDGRSEELVSLIDLLPTIAELTGVPIQQRVEGRSFANLLIGNGTTRIREYVLAESFKFDGNEGGAGEYINAKDFNPNIDSVNYSIRTKDYKYIFRFSDKEELYDIQNDPYENVNLADIEEQLEALQFMRELLLIEMKKTNPVLEVAVKNKLSQLVQKEHL